MCLAVRRQGVKMHVGVDDLHTLHQDLGFTRAELVQIAANGFLVALLPEQVKRRHLQELAAFAAGTGPPP